MCLIYTHAAMRGGMQLAHAAIHEGITAAAHATGKDSKVDMRAVPRCIYTSPEIRCRADGNTGERNIRRCENRRMFIFC